MTKEITHSFAGCVADLKTIPTRTGRNMVTLTVSGRKCKAFGDLADTCAALDGEEVLIEAREGSFRGEKEYAVIAVKAKLDGKEVSAKDTRRLPAPQSVAPTGPTPAGMVRWHVRPGERERFRAEIVKYGNARMLEIFDKLPHPQCRQEEMIELLEEIRKVERAYAQELHDHALGLGFTEDEIRKCCEYWRCRPDWNSTKENVEFAKEVVIYGLRRGREYAAYIAATSRRQGDTTAPIRADYCPVDGDGFADLENTAALNEKTGSTDQDGSTSADVPWEQKRSVLSV